MQLGLADSIMGLLVVLGGCVFFGFVLLIGLSGWSEGRITCGEMAFATFCWVLFLVISVIPGSFPYNFIPLVIPGIHLGVMSLTRGSDKSTLKNLNAADYATCERILARDPENAAAHEKLGRLYESDGLLPEALACFEEATKLEGERNTAIKQHHRYLLERVAMEESGHLKCPACRTMQQRDSGACWKCGHVFDTIQLMRTRLRRKGSAGKIGIILFILSLSLTIAITILLAVSGGSAAHAVFIVIGAITAVGSAAWLMRALVFVDGESGRGNR